MENTYELNVKETGPFKYPLTLLKTVTILHHFFPQDVIMRRYLKRGGDG